MKRKPDMKRKPSGPVMRRKLSGSELGSLLTGVSALLTAIIGAAWFFSRPVPVEQTPLVGGDPRAMQHVPPQEHAPDESRIAVHEPIGCKRVESIAALGWIEDSKTRFCQKGGWAGVTNFPGGAYRSAAGGFCYEGNEKACLALMLQRLSG
jgi:hypothetical protein